jgi:hypothetical protein
MVSLFLTAGVLAFYASPIHAVIGQAREFAQHGRPTGSRQIRDFQARQSPLYARIQQDIEFLGQKSSLPGPIYVCGNPLFNFLSGRKQAIPYNGWALGFYLPEQQSSLLDQLRRAHPSYIFVGDNHQRIIDRQFPLLGEFLEQNYRVLRRGTFGLWYTIS